MLSCNQKLICLGSQVPLTLNLNAWKFGGYNFLEEEIRRFSANHGKGSYGKGSCELMSKSASPLVTSLPSLLVIGLTRYNFFIFSCCIMERHHQKDMWLGAQLGSFNFAKFDAYRSCGSGHMFLFYHITSRGHMIKETCNLVSRRPAP